MSLVRHEIILRDPGLPSERCMLRSSCTSPVRTAYCESEQLYQESALPADTSEYLTNMMVMHIDLLEKHIGQAWLNGET